MSASKTRTRKIGVVAVKVFSEVGSQELIYMSDLIVLGECGDINLWQLVPQSQNSIEIQLLRITFNVFETEFGRESGARFVQLNVI